MARHAKPGEGVTRARHRSITLLLRINASFLEAESV
jgi:hypothetical protein